MYTSISIIFNPNSTGAASEKAHDLAEELKNHFQDLPIHMRETERPGHAEELAYEAAKSGKVPLIISASGDGGYNEVINGAMRATEEGYEPICAVLASGNANDHRRVVGKQPLLDTIIAQDISKIDLLEVRWGEERRFAHSYIGFGLTPVVAVELNRHTLNAIKELFLVVQTYWKYQPFAIELDNNYLQLDSLVLANIPEMAKVLELSEDGKPTDGKFEVIMVPHRHKLSMLTWALKSATIGLGKQPQAKQMSLKTLQKMPMQLDGEVVHLASDSDMRVSIAHKAIKTLR